MKKIITLLMAIALTATASAQVAFNGRYTLSNKILNKNNIASATKKGFSHNARPGSDSKRALRLKFIKN